jgi:hypothetical protein
VPEQWDFQSQARCSCTIDLMRGSNQASGEP